MTPAADSFDLLVERIADGTPVDWTAAAELCESDDDREQLGNLRLIASVCEVHRTPQPGEPVFFADSLETTHLTRTMPTMWGDLRVSHLLGRGAFGEVYLARDEQLRRPVALKLLREDFATVPGLEESILEEGRRLASVDHPNVVTVFGADVRNGRAGFWMEYLPGTTLEDALQARGPYSPSEAARVGRDICDALSAVHGAGIVHRDVKARNIVQDKDGKVVLMDFGAGLEMQRLEDPDTDRIGTPLYLAPEVLEGAPASVASDLYAVGILLFHLLTGRYPYTATTVDSLRMEHREGRREAIARLRPTLPSSLVRVIDRALAENPAQRFSSAPEMAAALVGVIDQTARRPRVTAFVLAGALAVGGVLLVNSLRSPGVIDAPRTIAVPQLTVEAGTAVDPSLPAGLTHEIVRELQARGILVRGSMSSAQLAGFSLPEIQSRASADSVLKGTIGRVDGQRLRVTVDLLRTKDGTSILSRRFMPAPTELPDIGAAIAADVSRVLGGSSAVRPKPLIAADAYDHYLRGRFLAEQRTPESLNLAVQSYRKAIAADPTYAQPWVGLADAYVSLGIPTFGPLRPLESRRLAKEAVLKALDLDAQSAEAHCTMGFISYFQDWSWRQAENEFRRALVLNPEYALGHDWYGDYLNAMGRFPEAMQQITRARQIDPLSPLLHRDVAWHYFFQRRFDEAVTQLRETLTMDASFGPAHSLLARALIEKREYDEALAELSKAHLPQPTYLAFVAYAHGAAGHRKLAVQHLRDAIEAGRGSYLSPYYVALVHTVLGQQDQAMDWLERSYDQSDFTLVNVYTDPRFDALRTNPRFRDLIVRMGFETTH
jgi:tetratricopeptide (TPR) repeat protein